MEYMITRMNSDELYHHGIKGQRWGIRRYQNADGSLTSAGRQKLRNWKHKQYQKSDKRYHVESWKKRADKAYAQANRAYELGRKIKFTNAKKEYDRKDKLVDKYVKDASRDTGVDWNKAKRYKKKLDSANERLTKRTEEYLSSLKDVEVKSLLKKDIERGYHYISSRIFDPYSTYERDVRVSDEFANKYK